MRFILIPDKFKGSLSAEEVIAALSNGIRRVYPHAEIHSVIASDGGDGFLDAVAHAVPVEVVTCPATDPLMREITARYLIDRKQKTAYVELAECSGMVLLRPEERNPLNTTTLGTGMQIRDAVQKGAKTIYVGLGGSATNDGGVGIAHGMGFRFLDKTGRILDPTGRNLSEIYSIDTRNVQDGLADIRVYAVNDVLNPLLGEQGAARVYASQKGAGEEDIDLLEKGLEHLAGVVKDTFGKTASDLPGSGAAGGAAFGLHTFLGAGFVRGVEFMLDLTDTKKLFEGQSADLLITGEGAIDEQTLQGKLIHGVVELGKQYALPTLAICGKLDLEAEKAQQYGLEAILEIRDKTKPTGYSMEHASELLERTIEVYLRHRKGRG